jgi:hypothetical protein
MAGIQTYLLRPQQRRRKEKCASLLGNNKSVAHFNSIIWNSPIFNKHKTQPSSLPQQHNKLSFQIQHVEWNTKFAEKMRHCTMETLTGFTFIDRTVCKTYLRLRLDQ